MNNSPTKKVRKKVTNTINHIEMIKPIFNLISYRKTYKNTPNASHRLDFGYNKFAVARLMCQHIWRLKEIKFPNMWIKIETCTWNPNFSPEFVENNLHCNSKWSADVWRNHVSIITCCRLNWFVHLFVRSSNSNVIFRGLSI